MSSFRTRSRIIIPSALAVTLALLSCSRREPYPAAASLPASGSPMETLDDPRLARLMDAAQGWRRMRGPERQVVDQVVLVADVPGFLAALAAWDDRSYFPILIDDPRWTIPFLKAFRPARVVRRRAAPRRYGDGPVDEWGAVEEAVRRAWVADDPVPAELPPAGARPRGLGPTPPGVVLSHPGSPALAGAAALAAGRFQPLIRVGRVVAEDRRDTPLDYRANLSEAQAIAFARRVEARVASMVPACGGLGDDVDFLTLAGDWPFRYNLARGPNVYRGDRAVDDLIGRDLSGGDADLGSARTRWAYTGRLLGDAPTSVYRAMASLFLQPESALLWNTYGGGLPWSDYDVAGAGSILELIRPHSDVEARSGTLADLASWHETMRRPGGRDLLMLNSSGSPKRFSIAGGSGVPGDVPFAVPSVVSMIHSFSAADPTDPDTLAGRFLDRGSFIYYGSMNEPFLISFRAPYILSQLITAEVPMAAAMRQGPDEAFGLPWRLAYLGDPLYRVDPTPARDRPERASPGPIPAGAFSLSARPEPEVPGAAGTLDWCYDSTLVAAATLGPAATPDVLQALQEIDRGQLGAGRRDRFDALLIDRMLAAGDVSGLLDRLLRMPARDRTPMVWRAIETAAFDQFAARLREDRFEDALDLWQRIVDGPWPPDTDLPGELTGRVAAAADPSRIPSFRRRLVQARDRLASLGILPERREMLSDALRKLDNEQAR